MNLPSYSYKKWTLVYIILGYIGSPLCPKQCITIIIQLTGTTFDANITRMTLNTISVFIVLLIAANASCEKCPYYKNVKNAGWKFRFRSKTSSSYQNDASLPGQKQTISHFYLLAYTHWCEECQNFSALQSRLDGDFQHSSSGQICHCLRRRLGRFTR